MCGFPPNSAKQFSEAGCPPIQLNSDTIDLEAALDPTGEGSILQDGPPQPRLQMPVTSLGCHLCFGLTRLEVPTNPLLGFDEFARTAHGTQRHILLTGLAVCYKAHKSGTARWRDGWSKVWRKDTLSPNLRMFTNPEAL